EIKNLNLGFETEQGFKQALYDVSFELNSGKMLAIVGESGCGKTMSAMSILRLCPKNAKITSGEIIFDNKNLLSIPRKEIEKIRGTEIALIPQDPMSSLNPLYTIGNQLLEVIKKHQNIKGKEAEKKAIEALEAVQIPQAKQRLNSYPHEFSGGMKQRTIIAMALACNAKVIIADEPTTALDVTIQAQIMDLLEQIKIEKQTAILLITHDLGVVKDCADDISVMYSGKIIENAPVEEFFKNPKHPYSKGLLNSLPTQKNKKLYTIEGQPPSIYEEIQGCKFHPRCSYATQNCRTNIPELIEYNQNHFCACFEI
ncbi:MAG: ABC transporter ATP-binding protein, partial [bacterium]|nr:ABC transporter ATP-binding protein [bacterium]